MVIMTHSWFKVCYWKYLSENFTIAWLFHQKRVELSRQDMQKIISSLVILLYLTFSHPHWRRCLQGARSCLVLSVAYLPKICIHSYYHGEGGGGGVKKIKDQRQNAQNRRSGEMSNGPFEIYKISMIQQRRNIYQTSSDMTMSTMCAYPL